MSPRPPPVPCKAPCITTFSKFGRIDAATVAVTEAKFEAATGEEIYLREARVVIKGARVKVGGRGQKVVKRVEEVVVAVERVRIDGEAVTVRGAGCRIVGDGLDVKVNRIKIVAKSVVIRPI